MNKNMWIAMTLVALSAVLLPSRATARLGETGDEISKRFGSEERVHPLLNNASLAVDELGSAFYFTLGTDSSQIMEALRGWSWDRVSFRGYRFGEFNVCIILLDDKSVFENYSR